MLYVLIFSLLVKKRLLTKNVFFECKTNSLSSTCNDFILLRKIKTNTSRNGSFLDREKLFGFVVWPSINLLSNSLLLINEITSFKVHSLTPCLVFPAPPSGGRLPCANGLAH